MSWRLVTGKAENISVGNSIHIRLNGSNFSSLSPEKSIPVALECYLLKPALLELNCQLSEIMASQDV